MYIVLRGKRNDHGKAMIVSEMTWIWKDHFRDYYKTDEGVFRRADCYYDKSPYGWEMVLPCYIDKWGIQS